MIVPIINTRRLTKRHVKYLFIQWKTPRIFIPGATMAGSAKARSGGDSVHVGAGTPPTLFLYSTVLRTVVPKVRLKISGPAAGV